MIRGINTVSSNRPIARLTWGFAERQPAHYRVVMRAIVLALPCLMALLAPASRAASAPDAAIQTAGKLVSASTFCQSYGIDRAHLAAYAGVAGDALDAWMADHDAEIRSVIADQSNLRESSPRAYCTTA